MLVAWVSGLAVSERLYKGIQKGGGNKIKHSDLFRVTHSIDGSPHKTLRAMMLCWIQTCQPLVGGIREFSLQNQGVWTSIREIYRKAYIILKNDIHEIFSHYITLFS